MVRTILRWTLIGVIALLIVFWLLGGGISRIIGNASPYTFSFHDLLSGTSTFASFHLPGMPDMSDIGINYSEDGTGGSYQIIPDNSVPNGSVSPYSGEIVMVQGAAKTQTPGGQYIEISASPGMAPVDISGWTLQSPLTGALATIPEAASPFIQARVNTVESDTLSGGGVAYVITGASPIGVSFSENKCTGYLGTLQPFVPALPQRCPSPLADIPDTPGNEAAYGASCFTYLASLPPCTFPANPPAGLSNACVLAIQTAFSYNGCVAGHEQDPDFSSNSWRLYLAQGKALWRADHDVIRLLDGQNRVVDVLNY